MKLSKKITASLLIAAQLLAPAGNGFSAEPSSPAKFFDVIHYQPSAEAGFVEESWTGKSPLSLTLIQDAHSSPDAQKSIQLLLADMQKNGLETVFVEGAEGKLDPMLFRSFPDREALERVFEDFRKNGEIAGSVMAAVLNPAGLDYYGMEDDNAYLRGISEFLEADASREDLKLAVIPFREELETLKKKFYSPEALQVSEYLKSFYEKPEQAREAIQYLRAKLSPELTKYPRVSAVFTALESGDARNSANLDNEIRFLAGDLAKNLKDREKAQKINKALQDYQTETLGFSAFASMISDFARAESRELRPSLLFQEQVKLHKTLESVRGYVFFEEFSRYSAEVKKSVFKNPEEFLIDSLEEVITGFEKFSALEVSHSEWETLTAFLKSKNPGGNSADSSASELKDFQQRLAVSLPQLFKGFPAQGRFYENARLRESAFMENILKLMRKDQKKSAAVIAGGFHAEGLTALFREKGISYKLISPAMNEAPAESNYLETMRGNVSWRNYFQVQNGEIDLYKAFASAAVDRLIALVSAGDSVSVPAQLREWRGRILTELASRGESSKAGQYTKFLDDAGAKKAWLQTVDGFLNHLQTLKTQHELTPEKISGWNASARNITAWEFVPVVYGRKIPSAFVKQRSELRQKKWQNDLYEGVSDFRHLDDPSRDRLREQTPDWERMNILGRVFLDRLGNENPTKLLSLDDFREEAEKRMRAEGIWNDRVSIDALLKRMVKIGLLKEQHGSYQLAVSREILTLKSNHLRLINRQLKAGLDSLDLKVSPSEWQEDTGAALRQIISDYIVAIREWPLYPSEAQWPLTKAIALLSKKDMRLLLTFFQNTEWLTQYESVVEDLMLYMGEQLGEKVDENWLLRNTPRLKGRNIYYNSPETWFAAGGLGRVGQYHTTAGAILSGKNATMVTIEPYYPQRIVRKKVAGVEQEIYVDLDYSDPNLPVPVEQLSATPVFTFSIRVTKGDKRVNADVHVYKGTNRYGMEVYLIRDPGNYYGRFLYSYGGKYGATSPEFAEYMAKAQLKLIKKLEKIKKAKQGDAYKPPVIWANDGQEGLVSALKEVSDDIDAAELSVRQSLARDPNFEFWDLATNDDDEISLQGATVHMTTHTMINRLEIGWDTIDRLGFRDEVTGRFGVSADKYRRLFSRFNPSSGASYADFTSAGLRAADSVNGVAAMHVQSVRHLTPELKVTAITNGDDRKASQKRYLEIVESEESRSRFPDADPEYLTTEQMAVIKKMAKEKAKNDPVLLALGDDKHPENEGFDALLKSIDTNAPVVAYMGRLVEEKIGRRRAFDNENIRYLVSQGATVVIFANVQAGELSKRMFAELKALQAEVNAKGPGKFLLATGWGVLEQRHLFPLVDIQVNDSEPITEASGLTETTPQGFIELSLPTPEGIYNVHGEIMDFETPGVGHIVLPDEESVAGYQRAYARLLALYREKPADFAAHEVTSLRMTSIYPAVKTTAAYFREMDKALKSLENPLGALRRFAAGDVNEGQSFRNLRRRKTLVQALEETDGVFKFEDISAESERGGIVAYFIPNVPNGSPLNIVVIETGFRPDNGERRSAFIRSARFNEAVRQFAREQGVDRVTITDALIPAKYDAADGLGSPAARKGYYGSYTPEEIARRGLYVATPSSTQIQVLSITPTRKERPEALPARVDKSTIFFDDETSEPLRAALRELIPNGLLTHLGKTDRDLVWFTPREGFIASEPERIPENWNQEGTYLIVNKGGGRLTLALSRRLDLDPESQRKLAFTKEPVQKTTPLFIELFADGDDLYIGFGRMERFPETGDAQDAAFSYWYKNQLLPFVGKFGFSRVHIRQRILLDETLTSAGFEKERESVGTDLPFWTAEIPTPSRSELRKQDASVEGLPVTVSQVAGETLEVLVSQKPIPGTLGRKIAKTAENQWEDFSAEVQEQAKEEGYPELFGRENADDSDAFLDFYRDHSDYESVLEKFLAEKTEEIRTRVHDALQADPQKRISFAFAIRMPGSEKVRGWLLNYLKTVSALMQEYPDRVQGRISILAPFEDFRDNQKLKDFRGEAERTGAAKIIELNTARTAFDIKQYFGENVNALGYGLEDVKGTSFESRLVRTALNVDNESVFLVAALLSYELAEVTDSKAMAQVLRRVSQTLPGFQYSPDGIRITFEALQISYRGYQLVGRAA